MFFLQFEAKPREDNPERETVGGAFVNCWIERADLDEAAAVASKMIEEQGWSIVKASQMQPVDRAFYADGDVGLQYLRSHFKIALVTSGTISNSGPENGGDVGGCPFKKGGPHATQINVRLNGAKALASNVPWPGGACDLTAGHN